MGSMTGADLLIHTAASSGIDVCFTNPGTTEMSLVRALDSTPSVRTILGLFEGVCAGAADGYGRLAGKPAMTLLHQGPGFANCIAHLSNAQQARSPVLNIVGDHFTWHRAANPHFHLNIEVLAATVGWHRTTESVGSISPDVAEAIQAAGRGQIATLVVPHDYQLADSNGEVVIVKHLAVDKVEQEVIETAAELLRNSRPSLFMLGRRALSAKGLAAAARVKARTGCDLYTEVLPACWERGAGLPMVERTPYRAGEQGIFSRYEAVVLAGMDEPVTFAGKQGWDSRILKVEQEKVFVAGRGEDVVDAMERLADVLEALDHRRPDGGPLTPLELPGVPQGALTLDKAVQTLAALQPEGAIVVEEGITSCYPYYAATSKAARHTVMTPTGTTIGWGMACATGAAAACPDRPVIAFQGDGSAMYAVQALWTQAREGMNITNLVLSNRLYNALRVQIPKGTALGPVTQAVTELQRPAIGWPGMAKGLGVPAVSVATSEELAREFRVALAEPGPHLIEIVLP